MKQDAYDAVTVLYRRHYPSLVRLAVPLVQDVATAEGLVHDSFAAVHSASRGLNDGDRALRYLRQSVVNRCRDLLPRASAADRVPPGHAPGVPSPGRGAGGRPECSAVISTLWALAPRQREILVLLYYGGLSEAEVASAMGISKRAVRRHTALAMSLLRAELSRSSGS